MSAHESQLSASSQGAQILRLYHLYRVTLALLLALAVSLDPQYRLFDVSEPQQFRTLTWIYLSFSLVTATLRGPTHPLALLAVAEIDISMLCALFHMAGGVPSGIGNLVVVAVAIANFLMTGRIGFLLAATATLGLLGSTLINGWQSPASPSQYVQVGVLGALCFLAALGVQAFSQRLRHTESLASSRAVELANLEALNAQIIQRMRTGILVISSEHRVLLSNSSACELLGLKEPPTTGLPLENLSILLLERLHTWYLNPSLRAVTFQAYTKGPVLQPSFVHLSPVGQNTLLVFLEDASRIAQQAQQLNLASLGRLTASIAHEVRNPLGAISHAAQLLRESETQDASDQRLIEIICVQTQRMNRIIEDILQLSRRRQAEPQILDLKDWLQHFVLEFHDSTRTDQQLHLEMANGEIRTRMDPLQLHQVLTNLVQNGLRYSKQKHGHAQVWLKLLRLPDTELPALEIRDDGQGVASEHISKLFEPFFTTDSQGTGLGLYLSRELCASNQARLDYLGAPGEGGLFRITFAFPQKLA